MGKTKNENNNTNKNKNVININIDTKKRKSKKKGTKKRGNNIGATLSYPASTTTNNYITTNNSYPYNGYIPPSAPGILNRQQLLDQNTTSGIEVLQKEQKEVKEQLYKSQKDKVMAERIKQFGTVDNENKPNISAVPFEDPGIN